VGERGLTADGRFAWGNFARDAGRNTRQTAKDRIRSGDPTKTRLFSEGRKNARANDMAERAQNLQDTFLNYVRKNKTPLTIFLVNGVKLQGIVTWFDNFCVLLRRDGHSQLVYKHAISTVMPGAPLQLFEPGEDSPGRETD
jgi:host factor-I protein